MTVNGSKNPWHVAQQQHAAGNYAAASATCRQIIAADPDNSLANWMLSSIHLASSEPRLAASRALDAARHAPALRIEDLLKVTWALLLCGEQETARDLLLGIDPQDPARMRGLWGTARQLGLLDQHERALECLDAIADPQMRNASVSHLRGNLLGILGQNEAAAAAYEESIAKLPQFALAHLTLAQMGLVEGRGMRIDRIRRLLQIPSGNLDHMASLHYALFMELDCADDTAAAWTALAAGAAARNRELAHDPAQETRLFDQLIEGTDTSFLDGVMPAGPAVGTASQPIFIVGMPRTGTTMLERMLGNHPQVQTCGELPCLDQQLQWVANRTWPGMFDQRAAAEQMHLDARLLGQRYLDAVAWRLHECRYFTDKTPYNFMAVGLILKALPGARILHIHRDPMDACFSNFKVLFAPEAYRYSYSLRGLATHHANYARLMQHWNTVFPGRVLNVAYEDLVADSDVHAARILGHCELEPSQYMTDLSRNRSPVSTFSRNQVRETIHQRNVGGWRRYEPWLGELQRLLSAST